MPSFVALFRGINVGRAKRIAMADLRALLESLDYGDVRSLLNSGNVVFAATKGSAPSHAKAIRAAVAARLGVDALVIVKSAQEIAAIVAGNTLADSASDASRLLVAMTQDDKSLAGIQTLAQADWGSEALHLGPHAAYLWCADGILESKAAVALLKGLADQGTTRNWATLEKIAAMLAAARP